MYLRNIIYNFRRYSFLMIQMISRDFKVKYKRSVLGILWSLLYPLLMMSVMAIVFSTMFGRDIEGGNYLVYLMSGLVVFNYFNEATNNAMTSIIVNFSLMKKVYIPKYIFPLSKCLFVGINFLLTLIPLLLVVLITGAPITFNYLLLPYVFICMFVFTLGVSLFISAWSVFLRDVIYIYGIVITIWQYFTPIFYDLSFIPSELVAVFELNPLYQFIKFTRTILMYGKTPDLSNFIFCAVYAMIAIIFGCITFKSKQNKFIYYA